MKTIIGLLLIALSATAYAVPSAKNDAPADMPRVYVTANQFCAEKGIFVAQQYVYKQEGEFTFEDLMAREGQLAPNMAAEIGNVQSIRIMKERARIIRKVFLEEHTEQDMLQHIRDEVSNCMKQFN